MPLTIINISLPMARRRHARNGVGNTALRAPDASQGHIPRPGKSASVALQPGPFHMKVEHWCHEVGANMRPRGADPPSK